MPKKLSAKNKIAIVVISWLVLCGVMFLYLFPIMDGKNQAELDSMAQDRKSLVLLQAQDQSYKQAQSDLQELASKTYQPEDFFTKDISLVNEVKTLEDLAAKYNLKMILTGVNGTIAALPKADTASNLAQIPYGITLSGDFYQAVNFIETMENLSFVTNITSLSINAADKSSIVVSLGANFYLSK
jgi:Tfp pilus assembly protein PilO